MITELGIIAGDIWHFLDEHKESMLIDIISAVGKPRDTVLMSLGWLAREGHVKLRKEARDYKVVLTK